MRVSAQIDINAPASAVWAFVDDPARYLHFMSGVTRFEVVGDQRSGCGARYRMLMHVGSAETGGLVEVVEHVENRDLAWTSVLGLDQRARWRLRRTERGGTRVELRIQFGVAGAGIWGWLSEQLAAPIVRGNVRRTLEQLKRAVEHERVRAEAARRRSGRA